MGKVSLCAAGTGKISVAVAEEPDGHPLEPQTPVVADGRDSRERVQSRTMNFIGSWNHSFGFAAPSPAGKELVSATSHVYDA